MEKEFIAIQPEDISENTFKLIGQDWMLISAGNLQEHNAMTASWGGFGILWGKKICFCVIRPQRYTYEFIEKEETFCLSFFEENYRDVLKFFGSKSGRDVDKISGTGLTPVEGSQGAVYYKEAKLVLQCKKVYFQDINPENFLDTSIDKNYPAKDYHRMYVGEIVGCYRSM